MRFLKIIGMSSDTFCKCLDETSDVELLNQIQNIMMETNGYWKSGIPKWDEFGSERKGKKEGCCESIEVKKELLVSLLNEYMIRTFKDCPFRMHLSEK